MIVHWRSPLLLLLCAATAVALMMFLIRQSQSVNFMEMITFNIVYYFAESIRATPQLCTGVRPCLRSAVLFQGCQRRIGNSSCIVSLLTVPLNVIKAAVHVKDFMNNQHFFARRTLDRSCDKVAAKVVEFDNYLCLQCDGHMGIVAAGHHRTQPDAAESLSDTILF